MPGVLELDAAVGGQGRRDGVHLQRELRLGVHLVEVRRDVQRRLEFVGAQPEGIGQRQQNAPNLLGLPVGERDDVVVRAEDAERLEVETGAARRTAMDDARNGVAMFGAHDEHVSAVAVGDNLILQVFRRLPSAHEAIERRPKLRARASQFVADVGQGGARGVTHVAGRIDRAPDGGSLVLERRGAAGDRVEVRRRAA